MATSALCLANGDLEDWDFVAGGLLALLFMLAGCATSPTAISPTTSSFPEDAVPEALITAALSEAGSSGRRVLLVFGANWCRDSRAMVRRLMEDSYVAPVVRGHYVPVFLDVGERGGPKWDAPVVQRFGRPFEGRGTPALVVLDTDGSQLTTKANNPLRDSDHRHPRKLRQFLESSLLKQRPSP